MGLVSMVVDADESVEIVEQTQDKISEIPLDLFNQYFDEARAYTRNLPPAEKQRYDATLKTAREISLGAENSIIVNGFRFRERAPEDIRPQDAERALEDLKEAVMREVRLALGESHPKYSHEVEELTENPRRLIGAIAVYVGAMSKLPPVVVAPLVAASLRVVFMIGLPAYCYASAPIEHAKN